MTIGIPKQAMYRPSPGWFKAAHDARDTEAVFRYLVRDNERRIGNGLPAFEPSYELAAKVVQNWSK